MRRCASSICGRAQRCDGRSHGRAADGLEQGSLYLILISLNQTNAAPSHAEPMINARPGTTRRAKAFPPVVYAMTAFVIAFVVLSLLLTSALQAHSRSRRKPGKERRFLTAVALSN